jgi:flagellar biosynthesis protein FliP
VDPLKTLPAGGPRCGAAGALLVIDMSVSAPATSMEMMMLPPSVIVLFIEFPFFILIDR